MGWRDWKQTSDAPGLPGHYGPVTGFVGMNSNGANITVNLVPGGFGFYNVILGYANIFPTGFGATQNAAAGTLTFDVGGYWNILFRGVPEDQSTTLVWREFVITPHLNGAPVAMENRFNSLPQIPVLSGQSQFMLQNAIGGSTLVQPGDVLDMRIQHQLPPLTGGFLAAPPDAGIISIRDPWFAAYKIGNSDT